MANIIALPYEYFADPNRGRPLFNAQIYIGVADTDPLIPANRVDVFYVDDNDQQVIITQPVRTNNGGLTVNDNGDVVQIRTANDYSMRVFDRSGGEINEYNITNNAETGGATIEFVREEIGNRGSYSFATIADVDTTTETPLAVGNLLSVQDYATGNNSGILYFKVVPAGTGVADGGRYIDLPNRNLQLNQIMKLERSVKDFGAVGDGVADDSSAFFAALNDGGFLDLSGATLRVPITETYTVNKPIYIKNGTLNFTSVAALRVFTWVSGDLFRLEDVKITGNSNGTIDDSFDATAGTISLIRAELTSNGAARNLQVDTCSIMQMQLFEDNKNNVTSATAFRVFDGYIKYSHFENIPGHGFASNAFVGIDIEWNRFVNVGALCVDFSALCSNCRFVHNTIDTAAGIGKTQNRFNNNELILPENNTISNNNAINLTGGNASNVAPLKLSGKNDFCERNVVLSAGTTNADSIEVSGSANVNDNIITRTVNTSRSYVSTVTDPNLAGVLDDPIINIKGNRGSGMLNFARLQNTSPARITIERNRPSSLSKFINGEPNLNLPNLTIVDNGYEASGENGVGIQFATTTVSLRRLKIQGNTGKSQGTGLVAWRCEGANIMGNSFEHETGNNVDIISTNSYTIVGNAGSSAWGTTSGQQIQEANTQLV